MRLTDNSNEWLKYVKFVLLKEGRTSKDTRDGQAKCAPFAGAFHTNRGITYCTFKTLAAELGILPVSYDRFLNLTDQDAGKFIYRYYNFVRGYEFKPAVAIALTEAAYGSWIDDAFRFLTKGCQLLGKNIQTRSSFHPEMITAANSLDEKKLFDAINAYKWAYVVDYLGNMPKNKWAQKGWANRQKAFSAEFTPAAGSAAGAGLIAAIAATFI